MFLMIDMHHDLQVAGKRDVGLINIACVPEMKLVQPDIAWKHDHTGHPALFDWQVFNLTFSDREHL